MVESFCVLAVDAAYVHCGRSVNDVGRGPDSDQNSWDSLQGFDPNVLLCRVEDELELAISNAIWFGAKDGRLDSGGKRLERTLEENGFELRFRRMKVDEVTCRNRNCGCRHASRSDPIFVRRQAGVDVDIAVRTLELVYGEREATRKVVVLAAGDGDLAPLAEALVAADCELYLLAFSHSASPELLSLAHDTFELDNSWLVDSSSQKKKRNNRSTLRSRSSASTSSQQHSNGRNSIIRKPRIPVEWSPSAEDCLNFIPRGDENDSTTLDDSSMMSSSPENQREIILLERTTTTTETPTRSKANRDLLQRTFL